MEQQKSALPPVELTEENAAVHLKLLKRLRYFDLIVPNSRGTHSWTVFGYSGHRLCLAAAIVIIYTALAYGNCGFFAPVDYELSDLEFYVVLSANLFLMVNFFNTITLFCFLPEVTELLEVTRVDFLTTAACRRIRDTLMLDCRTNIIWFSNMYGSFCALAIVQWTLFAGVTAFSGNVMDSYRAAHKRVPTVIYMPFPVSVKTHNDYYLLFFTAEMLITMFSLYSRLMVDLYLLSFGWTISAHYEVLGRAFENLGQSGRRGIGSPTGSTPVESKSNCGDDDRDMNVNEELISILSDQRRLILKLKLFNTVARPIILTMFSANSGLIVLLTFVNIMIVSSQDSFSFYDLSKVVSVDILACLELFIYCNLINNLNEKRGAVNFSIYSSDWTNMDLKVKKLLLLIMRMNDANLLLIRASPIKIINLELFVSVIKTCYSITSVMGNSLGKKN